MLIIFFSAFLLIGVLRNTQVQELLAKSTSSYLGQKLGVKVWIDKVHISSYFRIKLNKVHIYDHKNIPMITAKSIQADVNIFQPISPEIQFNFVKVDSAYVNVTRYSGDHQLNINKLLSSLRNKDTTQGKKKKTKDVILGLKSLSVKRTHFQYYIEKDSAILVEGMDYEHIDVKNINIELRDIHLFNDSINGQVKRLYGEDKCGVVLKDLEAEAHVGPRQLILKNARLLTPRSNADLDLNFYYSSWYAYLNFIEDVVIEADVRSSKIHLEDIAFFAPAMQGMNNVVRVKGQVKGPIRNMKGKDIRLSYGSSTSFNGNLQMSGLPNVYETFIKLKLKDFATSIADLKSFKLPNGKQFENIPNALKKFGRIRVQGKFTGFYNDFVSEAEVYTKMGRLNTDIQFMNFSEDSVIRYRGDFEGRNFNLGSFANMEKEFGDINFNLQVEGQGLELASLDTEVVGQIHDMDFKNNELDTIYVDATIKENEFLGKLNIEDELIETKFIGNISLDKKNPYFDFEADFKNVKLARLGLVQVDTSASLSTSVHMNFIGSKIDSIIGEINIDSTKFYYSGENYFLDSLHILSNWLVEDSSMKSISISSDFVNGEMKGVYSLLQMPAVSEQFVQSLISQIEYSDINHSSLAKQDIDFNFKIRNTETITNLFLPKLGLPEDIQIDGYWNTNNHQLFMETYSDRVIWDNIICENPSLEMKYDSGLLKTNISVNEFIFKEKTEKDTLAYGIDRFSLETQFQKDSLLFDLAWENMNRVLQNSGDIMGSVKFYEEQGLKLEFNESKMIINDSLWTLSSGSQFIVDSGDLIFNDLKFSSKNQEVLLDGSISKKPDNDLLIGFTKFNISTIDILLQKYGLDFDGLLDGDVRLIDVLSNTNFLANLELNSFSLNGEGLGNAEIKSTWNTDQSVFINVNLEKLGNRGVYKPLYLEGFYYPKEQNDQLDIDLYLNHLSIQFLKPFLDEYVADLEGNATGSIQIKGQLKKPDLLGSMELARTQFRIKYLNTLYSLAGNLKLNNQTLGFEEVEVYDTIGNTAILRGGLTHEYLRNFGVDLNVQANNFVGLFTRKGMNELFYGSAIVTGNVDIIGPFDNVFLDIKATSNTGTDINIPINTTLGVSENNFIVFVDENDTTQIVNDKPFVPELSSFSLNMDVTATPDANINISLPAQMGTINAAGSGDLNMNLSRTGFFSMSGDYEVSNGSFFFQIRNLLNRKFSLNEGGTISWTGDPYNGILRMSANYQVKTSLNSLGLEQDSSYRSRVPVDCIIGLTGPIMNPNVKFDFEFPNATEEVKQYVYTKIDTSNSAEMSQQMLSLLVLNSFNFNDASNNSNITNVGSSSLQIVTNQISNWLSQISKDVDIGINYRPGGDLTNEELEVALSTQLFDERVSIDGNFGYQSVQNNPANTTSSIVGDLNVEVKLTKDGRLRLKAFNRTNTVDLMDNTSPYTQGVGIFYRNEFNSLKDLFKTKKQKEKKQKEEKEEESLKAIKEEDTLVDEQEK